MKNDVKDVEVFIKRVEYHHDINGEVTKQYRIGGKLGGEEFEKLLTEQEYDAGRFGTALFGVNNGCNLKSQEMAALNCSVITAGNYLWNTQGGVK